MLIPVKSIVGIKLVIFIMNAINKFSFPRHHYERLPALPTLPTGRQVAGRRRQAMTTLLKPSF